MYQKIIWSVFPSPHAVNVLDASRYNLRTPNGEGVTVGRRGLNFVAEIGGGAEYETGSNGVMAAWLNDHEVGGTLK